MRLIWLQRRGRASHTARKEAGHNMTVLPRRLQKVLWGTQSARSQTLQECNRELIVILLWKRFYSATK